MATLLTGTEYLRTCPPLPRAICLVDKYLCVANRRVTPSSGPAWGSNGQTYSIWDTTSLPSQAKLYEYDWGGGIRSPQCGATDGTYWYLYDGSGGGYTIYKVTPADGNVFSHGSLSGEGRIVATPSGHVIGWGKIVKPDGSTITHGLGYETWAVHGSRVFGVSGSTIKEVRLSDGAVIGTWTLSGTEGGYGIGTRWGDYLLFKRASDGAPVLRFDTSTGISSTGPVDPSIPSTSYVLSDWYLHSDGYLYAITNGKTSSVVLDPATGHWATGDLATVRGERYVFVSLPSGKLVIPSGRPLSW